MTDRQIRRQKKAWRNRIVGTGEEAPDQLLANPGNWRIHPKAQQDALSDSLDDIGWIQQVVVNRRTGHLVDGHLRVSLALRNNEPTVPVLYVDLDEREEALALATLDPIAAMAAADKEKLDALLREVDTSSAALQEMLTGLAEQAGLYEISNDDAREAVAKAKGDKRLSAVDLIYTVAHFGPQPIGVMCCIAVKMGWMYGFQSTTIREPCHASVLMGGHWPGFIDNDYFRYDHGLHLATVEKWRPKYCTVRDVMTREQCEKEGIEYYSLDQILRWAEELEAYAENVIVIPKFDCLADIPDKYMLGYSIPTSHGGTPLPIQAFAGRRVHLLGGSPNKQIAYWQELPDDVVSLDNNYLLKLATYGQCWMPDGTTKRLSDLGLGVIPRHLYVALAINLGNFAAYFQKQAPEDDQVMPELDNEA